MRPIVNQIYMYNEYIWLVQKVSKAGLNLLCRDQFGEMVRFRYYKREDGYISTGNIYKVTPRFKGLHLGDRVDSIPPPVLTRK